MEYRRIFTVSIKKLKIIKKTIDLLLIIQFGIISLLVLEKENLDGV